MRNVALFLGLIPMIAYAGSYWNADVEVDRGNEKSVFSFGTMDLTTESKPRAIPLHENGIACTLEITIPFGIPAATVACNDSSAHKFEIFASCFQGAPKSHMFIKSYKNSKYVDAFSLYVECSEKTY